MRTSPVHYIAPSAISITPNANESARDLAVHVSRGTKIKVCYRPIADLGYNDANYKEWTLRGRNRRLAQSGVPYTIYARLKKTDQTDGYLVFAQKVHDEDTDEWLDPYILSPNTSATSAIRLEGDDGGKYLWGAIPEKQAANGRSDYWWIKLGSVSAPNDEGLCSIDLDTGILGTVQYNMDWYLNPDNMPQRLVREIKVERGEWMPMPMVAYTGGTGAMAPDGTLDVAVAEALGWTGMEILSFTQGQEIAEPYHCRHLTRDRWLTHRLADYEAGYADAELYEKLTTPSYGWEEENWVETSRVWHNGQLWECQEEGTSDEPSEDSPGWRLLLQGGEDGTDGYSVELTKSADCVVIDPSGNVIGGYRNVSKDASQNEFYSFRFFTSVTVMRGGEYLHLCGALDDEEKLGEGNFAVEAIGAGCDLKVEGTTCYITGIWHCNDGDSSTPNTSWSESAEEYQLMRSMTEAVAHITLNIEGKTAVTKDYRLQLVHLPTDTVVIESHNEVAAVNWSTKKNAWTNTDDIVIPLTASSGGQPVMFQTVNGEDGPDIQLLNKPTWLNGFSLAWVDYKDGSGSVLYPASQHMAVEIRIPVANIRKNEDIMTSNLLRFNVVTAVDGVEYENIVPFTLNTTTDKAVYVLSPSVRQVTGTMIGGTWDPETNTVKNARYSYMANGQECSVVKCSLMAYDENNAMTEITSEADIHDNLAFLLNGQPSSLAAFRAGLSNTAVSGKDHNLFDELSEIVFAIRLDGNDYESEGVPILRNGAQLSIGDDGNWYIGGVNTEVFAKGTEVTDTKIYYTDPMDASTPPAYAPTDAQRGLPVSPYLKTQCPASVEGKFIHYVSITIFSDSEETYVYSYGTIGTGNTITVIHDRDYYASAKELTQAQLKDVADSKWSESTPADYSATNKYLYARDTARYYKNGAEQTVTVGDIAYPKIVYTLLSYWGQDGSGVEFAYYRANDDSTANKPSADVLNQNHPGTAKNPVIPDWKGADGGWYDDNPGFTAQGQVMYQSVNKYSNSTWSGWGDPVIIDRYAQNAVRLDLSNEMDMVQTDDKGKTLEKRVVTTVARLFDGAKEIKLDPAKLWIEGGLTQNIKEEEGNGLKLTFNITKNFTIQGGALEIKVNYRYPNPDTGTIYSSVLTIAASMGQPIFQLSPSHSSLSCSRKADNTLNDPPALSLEVVKINGASSESQPATKKNLTAFGVTVQYSTSAMPASSTDGSPWPDNNSVQASSSDTNVYIAMFNASGVLLDRETVPVVKDGKDGKSVARLDLSNEMDMVPTTSDKVVKMVRTVETVVRMFDGATEVDIRGVVFGSGGRISGGPAPKVAAFSESESTEGKGKKLSWTFNTGETMSNYYNITISYTHTDGVVYQAVFTVVASNDQAIYQLKPDMSSIPFHRSADNTLSPASRDITLVVAKIDGNSSENVEYDKWGRNPHRLTVRYSMDSMPTSNEQGQGSVWNTASVSVPNTKDNLFIALFNMSGVLIDRETIPVIKDGEKGEKGKDSTVPGPQGDYELITYAISAYKTAAEGAPPDDCQADSDWKATAPVPSVFKPFVWKRSIMYDPSTRSTYGNYSYVRLTGEDGDPGKPGKTGLWYRYLGVWGVDCGPGTSTAVTNTNTVGYYVKYGASFYMNVKDAGVPNTTTPGGTGWEAMNSVFEYFMTKVTFADSAYLGSFIFNGDWLISQHGTLDGDYSTRYERFDPAYPNSSVNTTHTVNGESWYGYNFVPNYAVDGKTGVAYLNDLHATGELRVVNSDGDGVVRINAGNSAASATEKFVTILDASGLYSRGDTDGFKMVHDRFGSRMVRWNNMKSEWVPFYAGRSVRGVYNDTNVDMDYDDFIICMTRELTLTFPSSGAREGKVITIKATGHEVTLKSSSQIFLRESDTPVAELALHGWDRAELVYWGGFWYWSYMGV